MHTGGIGAPRDQNNFHRVINSIDAESIGWKIEPIFTISRSMRLHKGENPESGGNPTEEKFS